MDATESSPAPALSRAKSSLVVCLLLFAGVALVYWPVVHFDFINFDDSNYVFENPIVTQGLTWKGIRWALTTNYANNWHPLTWISHMIDCQLFGLKPGFHHLTNVILHGVNTLLLFAFLRRTTGAVWQSAWVAAAFAIHPLHVESVAWVAERKDVLSAFFFLLTLLAYQRYAKTTELNRLNELIGEKRTLPSSVFYLLALVLFALGLLSKPMLVTLPLVLLLLDYWPLGRVGRLSSSRALFLEKIPFFALSAACCVITVLVQRQNRNITDLAELPVWLRSENAFVTCFMYVAKMAWPTRLAPFYPYEREIPIALAVGAFLFFLACCRGALYPGRRYRPFAIGWFWYICTLLPVIGIVQVGLQSRADRYTYLPLIGIFIMLAWSLPGVARKFGLARGVLPMVASVVIIAWGVAAFRQVQLWRNSETLFTHTLAVTRENALANVNLGMALLEKSKVAEAAAHFEEALRIRPDYGTARADLALTWSLLGKLTEAAGEYRAALAQNPREPKLHYMLANVLAQSGDHDGARAEYEAELRLNPNHELALNDLAWRMATDPDPQQRNSTQAIEMAKRACELSHYETPQFIGTLAAAYASAGRFSEAISTAERARSLALRQGDNVIAQRNEELLRLYRAGKAYHESAVPPGK